MSASGFPINLSAIPVDEAIANFSPATQESQQGSFAKIVQGVVQGTPAIIQAIKQPTQIYPSVVAQSTPGAASGAGQAQQNTALPSWSWALLGGAVIAVVAAGVLAFRR
jgi:hypothetical protein